MSISILEQAKEEFESILRRHDLLGARVEVLARLLTPEEAIGTPGRRDFPIIKGREKMLEAIVSGARGQAFTDSRREFVGTVAQVLALPLDSNATRAIFIATLNAVLRHLGIAEGTVHCRNDEPERCAPQIAEHIAQKFNPRKVALIGLNPAIAEALVEKFGAENVLISDLDEANIGAHKFGTTIRDGAQNEELIRGADFVLVTGTTAVNGTIDGILNAAERYGKPYLLYGVTISGIAALLGLPRICPYGK